MFNKLTNPREFPSYNSETIDLLFVNKIIDPPTPFRHNHYVPLNFCSEKIKQIRIITSQKYRESKKRVTYSIHHFWKQDSSAK